MRFGYMEAIIGALIIRIGFGVYYTITIIRNPQNPILIIKTPPSLQEPPSAPPREDERSGDSASASL